MTDIIKFILDNSCFDCNEVFKQDGKFHIDLVADTPFCCEVWTERISFDGTVEDFEKMIKKRAETFDIDTEIDLMMGKVGSTPLATINNIVSDTEWKQYTLEELVNSL